MTTTASTDEVVDVHAHLWDRDHLERLAAGGVEGTDMYAALGAGSSRADLDRRFAMMDRAGIHRQILSSTPMSPHLDERTDAVEAARLINDRYAEVVSRHPDRFGAHVSLPLPHVDAALDELARGLDELGMVGVAVTTDVGGRALTDPWFAPVLEELDRRGAVLYIHPAGHDACSTLIAQRPMRWSVGAPIEDSIALADLLISGTPSRYPRVRFVGSHLGGALPMLLPRMDAQVGWESPATPEPPSVAARRMWFDTVAHDNIPALRAAADVLGADRLVLGTDYPFQLDDEFMSAVSNVRDELSSAEADAILGGNVTEAFRHSWAARPERAVQPTSGTA